MADFSSNSADRSAGTTAHILGAAPGAAASHPTAEHLIPLMVVAGTSNEPGERIYEELVLQTAVSGFIFN